MIKHKLSRILICAVLTAVMLIMMTGCGGTETTADPGIADGTYVASFTTDNSMFHVNEANQDKGILTVKDGKMTIHVSLQSKKIINLYPGLAEDAKKDGAELLEPTTDKVVYSDGYEDEVYGFDIPVPALDEEFDLALIGIKGIVTCAFQFFRNEKQTFVCRFGQLFSSPTGIARTREIENHGAKVRKN